MKKENKQKQPKDGYLYSKRRILGHGMEVGSYEEHCAYKANKKLEEWFTSDEGNREFMGIQILAETVKRLADENTALKTQIRRMDAERLHRITKAIQKMLSEDPQVQD